MDRSSLRSFLRYAATRIIFALVAFVLLVSLDFYLVEIAPGDPTRAWNAGQSMRTEWGLALPPFDRYLVFLQHYLAGNFGSPSRYPGSVLDLIEPNFTETLARLALAMFVSALIGIALAKIAGRDVRRRRHRGVVIGSILASSIPILGVGVAFQYYGSRLLGLPTSHSYGFGVTYADPLAVLADRAFHNFLPLCAAVVFCFGFFTLSIRDHLVWKAPESPTKAQLKRLARWRRGAREVGPPVLRTVATHTGWMLGMIMLLEFIFSLNGVGYLINQAIQNRDMPLASGIFVTIGGFLTATFVAADLLARLLGGSPEERVVGEEAPRGPVLSELIRSLKSTVKRPLGKAGIFLILLVCGMAVLAPWLVGPYDQPLLDSSGFYLKFLPPSLQHLLGTNQNGVDNLALMFYGAQVPLLLSLLAFLVAFLIGTSIAFLRGFQRERLTGLASWLVDFTLLIGWLPFVHLLFGVRASGTGPLIAIALVSWPIPVRIFIDDLRTKGNRPDLKWRRRAGVLENARRGWQLFTSDMRLRLGASLLAGSIAVLMQSALAMWGFLRSTPGSWGDLFREAEINSAIFAGMWWWYATPVLFILILVAGLGMLSLVLRDMGKSNDSAVMHETNPPTNHVEPKETPTEGEAPRQPEASN